MNRLLVIALLLTPTVPTSQPGAYDWPQFGGPFRNFHARAGDLAQPWPDQGARLAWSRPLGEGFSGIAAVGGALFSRRSMLARARCCGRRETSSDRISS